MCMEDIRIGRETSGTIRSGSVGTTAGQLIPPNPKRTALVISAPAANRMTLSDSPGVVIDGGITLHPDTGPLHLTLTLHGAIVTKALFAIIDTAAETIGWLETHLDKE